MKIFGIFENYEEQFFYNLFEWTSFVLLYIIDILVDEKVTIKNMSSN